MSDSLFPQTCLMNHLMNYEYFYYGWNDQLRFSYVGMILLWQKGGKVIISIYNTQILFLSSWSQYTITVTFGKESECWRFVFVFLFCCGITIKLFCSSDYILIIFKILLIYPITCLTFSAFTLLCFVDKTWYFNLNESIFGNSIFCIFDSTSDIC